MHSLIANQTLSGVMRKSSACANRIFPHGSQSPHKPTKMCAWKIKAKKDKNNECLRKDFLDRMKMESELHC